MVTAKRTGIFGGTFNPVHLAHLAVAEEVKAKLDLERVLFVPAGQPQLRSDTPVAAEHRVEMVRLAIAGSPGFELSTIEVERPGPSYTVDTIAGMQKQFGPEAELWFILGWDSLSELPRWHEPARLVQMCRLVAVKRPGVLHPDLKRLSEAVPGLCRRVIILEKPEIDISASEIRERIAQGQPFENLVPQAVARYIKEHRLYVS